MEKLLKKHETKVRFLAVGVTNTVIDFALLFLFTNLGVNRYIANILSTGVAFVFSFFANKKFTFRDGQKDAKKQFLVFSVVTLSGLWLLQPLIIWIVTDFLAAYTNNQSLILFLAKVIATIATLVWNYILYSKVVFVDHKKQGS